MPKTPVELEEYLIHPEKWSLAPHPVYQMAEISSKEGVFTGITWDDYYGWTILLRDPDPRIGWCERNFPNDLDIDDDWDLEFPG